MKVFIAGPRAISKLDGKVEDRLHNIFQNNITVVVGDYGFMLWNGKSKGTLNNIINLTNRNKNTLVYFAPDNEFHIINNLSDIDTILNRCDDETRKLYSNLFSKIAQLSIME